MEENRAFSISALNCGNLTDLAFPGMCESSATLLSGFPFLLLTSVFSVTGHQWDGANRASRLAECHAVCYSHLQILWNLNPWDTTTSATRWKSYWNANPHSTQNWQHLSPLKLQWRYHGLPQIASATKHGNNCIKVRTCCHSAWNKPSY